MATTTFSGPVRAGTVREGASANVGNVVLSQKGTIAYTDDGTAVAIGTLTVLALISLIWAMALLQICTPTTLM
jgi:hypothetical protein